MDSRSVKNSDKLIKWFNDQLFVSVIIHELLHALGLYHIDEERFSESVMNATINKGHAHVYTSYLDAPTFSYWYLCSSEF